MKRVLLILLIATLPFQAAIGQSLQSQSTQSADEIISLDISDVVSQPKQYDGLKVTLEGVVKKVKYTKSAKGEDFTLFKLKDPEGREVNVYYEDERLAIKKGDTVRITGKFRKQKKYFLYKIKNVIKANTVEQIEVSP